jgi:hypothetical protein
MKAICISFISTLALCSISFSQTSGRPAAYPASTLSNGINLRSVAGAPFSADMVIQSIQVQADGTPLTRETHGKMFRDSLGRTRSETELQNPVAGIAARRFVTIIDPVQQTSMVLDVAAKTATIFHLSAAPAATASKLALATVRQDIKHLTPPGSEDLGAMMMEGFAVTGTRRTRTAEAGAAKDMSPNVVTESWFSKELKVDLVNRQGLQSSSRTTRLTNITPGDPDPTVFQVPADYTVRDNSQAKSVTQ